MQQVLKKENNDRNSFYSEPKEINRSENTKNTEETQEILRLSVDLGNNQLDYIHIFKNSEPEKLAYYFCTRNQLDYEYLQPLIEQIKDAINVHKTSSSNLNALSLRELPETPAISPKPKDEPVKTPNKPNSQLEQSSSCKPDAMKKSQSNSNRKGNSQLTASIESKKALFSTETYLKTQAKPASSYASSHQKKKKAEQEASSGKLPQSASSKNKLTLHKEPKLEQNLKASSSQAKMKQSRPFSSASTPLSTPLSTTSGFQLNYGERLYHKGLKLQDRTKDKLSFLQREISQSNISSYKPTTNMISYNALSKRLMNRKSYNNEHIILGYKDYLNSKMEQLKEKHRPKDHSFSPKLNKKSLSIENAKEKERAPNEQRYKSLYENYKSQKLNIEKLSNKVYDKDKMFKPLVNQYECAYTSMSFNDRQGYFSSKSLEKQNKAKQKMETEMNKDRLTGQSFFRPEINSECNLSSNSRSRFDDLHNDHNRLKLKKKALKEAYNEEFLVTYNSSHMSQQSNEIVEGLKAKAFKAIFNLLDKDKDGSINQRNISISALPKNIALILEPIFVDLMKENRTLSKEDFVAVGLHLFNMISYTQKKEIMSFIQIRKINNPNNFSFKPKINTSLSSKNIKHSISLSNQSIKQGIEVNGNKKVTEVKASNDDMGFSIKEEGTQEEKNENDANEPA